MSTRFATTVGPSSDERESASDPVGVREPTLGAQARTKGSLYLLAQLTGTGAAAASAREALAVLEREYYHDLTGGVPVALERAVSAANRLIYQHRGRLGVPERNRIGLVGVVIHGRDAHVVRIGAPAVVLVRGGRLYEVPAAGAAADGGRTSHRRLAVSLGGELGIRALAWQGALADGDRIALVSRHLARVVGRDELRNSLAAGHPAAAVQRLRATFAARGGSGSNGILVIDVSERPSTDAPNAFGTPGEAFAVWPDRSPVPLADAIGREFGRGREVASSAGSRMGGATRHLAELVSAVLPHRRAQLPRGVQRTSEVRDGRRRRLGLVGMMGVAALVAVGSTVATLPAPRPTDAIPRAAVARDSIAEAAGLLGEVDRLVRGADLVDREPDAATTALAQAHDALERASGAGVADAQLAALRDRVEEDLDRLHRVTRVTSPQLLADLRVLLDDVEPADMVAASDGTLWVLESGRGRVVRIEPATGAATVVYRAGQAVPTGLLPGDPWLLTTAATDMVVIDRDRTAWRIDLTELVPRPMTLSGIETVSPETTLLAALQHRPPLEIFTLYAVDGATGEVVRWTPPPLIPVEFPDPPELYLSGSPDLDPLDARDLRVDVNGWLLHAGTVTRIDFGTPRGQDEYSLDPPPDAPVRLDLDYRHLDGAMVGEREMLFVHDAANARILAFSRADGAFLRQWMAPSGGPDQGSLDDIRGLSVPSVADGPPVAYLLTGDGVVRLVLE